jgi:hypothetical protein
MIRNARDLSPDQKAVIESLLGRRVLDDEAISVRAPFTSLRSPISGGKNSSRSYGGTSPKWTLAVSPAPRRKPRKSSPRPCAQPVRITVLSGEGPA